MWKSDWIKNRKKAIIMVAIMTILLCVVQVLSYVDKEGKLKKENGQVIAIEREGEENISFPMVVEAERNGRILTYEEIISLTVPKETNKQADETATAEQEHAATDVAVRQAARQIENQEGSLIYLPKELEDGTRLSWKSDGKLQIFPILLLFPLSLFFLYRNDVEKKRAVEQRKNDCMKRMLPGFCDQILLMLNCGLIFQDAFSRIIAGCEMQSSDDDFSKLLISIKKEADASGKTIASVMKEQTQKLRMQEYTKIVNIIIDNQHRGINLQEKLESESLLLWEGRKAFAMQRGKEIETKMAFPLALLLVVLILISGVPALMNM